MIACWCSLAGTAACQTCSQNPFAVMSKLMTPQPTALRYIMVNLQTEKPMTNADLIRAMSDEELSEFLIQDGDCPPERMYPDGCPNCDRVTPKVCCDCWLDWLRQEAKE